MRKKPKNFTKVRVAHTQVGYGVPGVEDPASPQSMRTVLDDILATVKRIETELGAKAVSQGAPPYEPESGPPPAG